MKVKTLSPWVVSLPFKHGSSTRLSAVPSTVFKTKGYNMQVFRDLRFSSDLLEPFHHLGITSASMTTGITVVFTPHNLKLHSQALVPSFSCCWGLPHLSLQPFCPLVFYSLWTSLVCQSVSASPTTSEFGRLDVVTHFDLRVPSPQMLLCTIPAAWLWHLLYALPAIIILLLSAGLSQKLFFFCYHDQCLSPAFSSHW